VIAVLSIAALAACAEYEERINLIVGLWVIVSPWALHFFANITAIRTNVIVGVIIGVIVAVVAAIEIWLTHGTTPRVTQAR